MCSIWAIISAYIAIVPNASQNIERLLAAFNSIAPTWSIGVSGAFWVNSENSLKSGKFSGNLGLKPHIYTTLFSFFYQKIVKHLIWLAWINMLSLPSSALWICSSRIPEFELKTLSQLGYLPPHTLSIPSLYGSFSVSSDFYWHKGLTARVPRTPSKSTELRLLDRVLYKVLRARSRCNLSNDRLHE